MEIASIGVQVFGGSIFRFAGAGLKYLYLQYRSNTKFGGDPAC